VKNMSSKGLNDIELGMEDYFEYPIGYHLLYDTGDFLLVTGQHITRAENGWTGKYEVAPATKEGDKREQEKEFTVSKELLERKVDTVILENCENVQLANNTHKSPVEKLLDTKSGNPNFNSKLNGTLNGTPQISFKTEEDDLSMSFEVVTDDGGNGDGS